MQLLGVILILAGIQAAVLVALLVERLRRARKEESLFETERQLRLLVDRAPVMLWTARPDTTLDFLNSFCADFTGLPVERLRNEGWLDAVHPEDRDGLVASYTAAIEARDRFLVEYRARRADGTYRWLLATGVPNHGPDGTFVGYIGCDVDITERRNAEGQILESRVALQASHREVQLLAGRLIEAQDGERARLARDLHDDVSQELAGLSIALSNLRHRMNESLVDEGAQADVVALQQRVISLAQNVRHLSHDLHPTVLRHVGLVAALTSHCATIERLHGVASTCRAEGDFESIAPEVALCLYRIVQESLRNVIAHAAASHADVRLLRTGDCAEVRIADDGKGFDFAHAIESGKGLGLVSITERVRLAGGTVSISAEPNQGTRVRVQIPAHAAVRASRASCENRETV